MNRRVKLKIPIIGNPRSGKSAFIHNLVQGKFLDFYTSTEGYQVSLYMLQNNKNTYQIQLWDCGTQHFQSNKFVRSAFFRNASASFIIFDMCDRNWKQTITNWIQQAYRNQCYLVYAIGSKKEKLLDRIAKAFNKKKRQNENQQRNQGSVQVSLVEVPLLSKKMSNSERKQQIGQEIMQIFEQVQVQFNRFFTEQYQIKHFYQSAKQKVHIQIKNIFITLNDDRQKLTRSSIARGIKFDNSEVEEYMNKMSVKQSTLKKQYPSIYECQQQQQSSEAIYLQKVKSLQLQYQKKSIEGLIKQEILNASDQSKK